MKILSRIFLLAMVLCITTTAFAQSNQKFIFKNLTDSSITDLHIQFSDSVFVDAQKGVRTSKQDVDFEREHKNDSRQVDIYFEKKGIEEIESGQAIEVEVHSKEGVEIENWHWTRYDEQYGDIRNGTANKDIQDPGLIESRKDVVGGFTTKNTLKNKGNGVEVNDLHIVLSSKPAIIEANGMDVDSVQECDCSLPKEEQRNPCKDLCPDDPVNKNSM